MRWGGIDGVPLILDVSGNPFTAIEICLDSHKNTSVTFDEFECWQKVGNDWKNIAKLGTATQSSIWKEKHPASSGCNGAVNGDIGVHTGGELKPWWKLSFDEPRQAQSLIIFNRIAYHADRMDNVLVQIELEGDKRVLFDGSKEQYWKDFYLNILERIRERLLTIQNHIFTPIQDYIEYSWDSFRKNSVLAYEYIARLRMIERVVSHILDDLRHGKCISQTDYENYTRTISLIIPLFQHSDPQMLRFSASAFEEIHIRSRKNLDFLKVQVDSTKEKNPPQGNPHDTLLSHISPRLPTQRVIQNSGHDIRLIIDSRLQTEFEVWGSNEKNSEYRLIFDSRVIVDSINQIQYVLDQMYRPSFEGLNNRLRCLEALGTYHAAFILSKAYSIEKPENEMIENLLSEIETRSLFTAERPVGRTKHGYKHTHKFHDQKKYLEGLRWFQKRLQRLASVPSVVSYGTLLGLVRDDGLIPHDDDADLVILFESSSFDSMMEERNKLQKLLQRQRGLKVYVTDLPGKNIPLGFDHKGQWVHLDIFPSYANGGERFVLNERLGGFQPVDEKIFLPPRPLNKCGLEFTAPNDIDGLLTWWYGDWHKTDRQYRLQFGWEKG